MANDLLYIFIMIGEMLRSYRKFAKVKFEGDWAELQPKICLL